MANLAEINPVLEFVRARGLKWASAPNLFRTTHEMRWSKLFPSFNIELVGGCPEELGEAEVQAGLPAGFCGERMHMFRAVPKSEGLAEFAFIAYDCGNCWWDFCFVTDPERFTAAIDRDYVAYLDAHDAWALVDDGYPSRA